MPNALPQSMTAIAVRAPGGPEVLCPEERPLPAPGKGEVLVEVAAAGVNRPDILQRKGQYPPPEGASDIPGLEFAGTVVAAGPGAEKFAVGDKVTALVAGGGYAEYCAVHETNALPVPADLSMVEAAAIPETFFTVWSNVFERGQLKPGEVLLVHGGASGIGTTAIMLARALGSLVIATAGSDEKCELCERLGTARAVNYSKEDFVAAVKEVTDGHGADVILDMVGGDYIERNYAAAAVEGRIVQIAFLRGETAKVNFRRLMLKRLTHTGSTLRARDVTFKAGIAKALKANVWPLFESGTIRPVIDSTYPAEEAAKAHARMETNAHMGKIVLTFGARNHS
jgi:putative PIG3 family NAD(P)H quinone oxidoreductase